MAHFSGPWMPWFHGDFLKATQGWTLLESGLYFMLLGASWELGPLPNDPARLAGIARASTEEFNRAWKTVKAKFQIKEQGLVNLRLEQHREAQSLKSEKARQSAQKRWTGHANAHANAPATAYANASSLAMLPDSDPDSDPKSVSREGEHEREHPPSAPLRGDGVLTDAPQTAAENGTGLESEALNLFLRECTQPGWTVLAADLFRLYERFCRQQGRTPISKRRFERIINARGYTLLSRKGRRQFRGLNLVERDS